MMWAVWNKMFSLSPYCPVIVLLRSPAEFNHEHVPLCRDYYQCPRWGRLHPFDVGSGTRANRCRRVSTTKRTMKSSGTCRVHRNRRWEHCVCFGCRGPTRTFWPKGGRVRCLWPAARDTRTSWRCSSTVEWMSMSTTGYELLMWR